MKLPSTPSFLVCYIAIAIAITGASYTNHGLYTVLKPLLMPMLIAALFFSSYRKRPIILAALLFAWAGDVLLMFEDRNAHFFIAGLVCFLLTHILYISYFIKIRSARVSLLRKHPWMAALVMAYGVSLVIFLAPHLGEMKYPVIMYALVICVMVICSIHVFNKTAAPANRLFVTGAILFAASDSILAVNKFYHPFANAGMLIIITYCAAQLLIVYGVIKEKVEL